MKRPAGISEDDFYDNYCPPLPDNHEPQENEPDAIASLISARPFRQKARDQYSEKQWRMHRWAYCRLTEMVDAQIQKILTAVKEKGEEENTIIFFSSDHGDNDSSHKLEHKTVLYEESANVPFVAMWKNHFPAGKVDSEHLVSNGLDILPTICDYAGVEAVADSRGASLRSLFEKYASQESISWRNTLGVESELGRMVIREDGLKYIRYDVVGIEEQLLDIIADPGETKDYATDPHYRERLLAMRESFEREWFPEQ